MKSDAIAFGIAGMLFGLIAGWIIGSQQATLRRGRRAGGRQRAAAPAAGDDAARRCSTRRRSTRSRPWPSASRRTPRRASQLGNLYFDAERFDEAIKWYERGAEARRRTTSNVSTDLGVCYYYTNQPDKALEQFDQSLKIDPKHAKTLLNIGIVRAFGKQDLDGRRAGVAAGRCSSRRTVPEGQAAKRALDSLRVGASGDRRRRRRSRVPDAAAICCSSSC